MPAKTWTKEHLKKVIAPESLAEQVHLLKNQGRTVATLNGSFDLLHAGHLQIIYEASQQADFLIVALNSDESIRQYKSADRPIIPLRYRLEMMSALQFVSYVTWFNETDPRRLLSMVQPNVHVNGSEYGKECIESEIVKAAGGRIHLVELIPGLSTSEIIKKIAAIDEKSV